jgi:hypothetical protein
MPTLAESTRVNHSYRGWDRELTHATSLESVNLANGTLARKTEVSQVMRTSECVMLDQFDLGRKDELSNSSSIEASEDTQIRGNLEVDGEEI